MKKIKIIFSILIILLTGCSITSSTNDDYTEVAINCALNYLNDKHGYDLSNTYTLNGYNKSESTISTQLFTLSENNECILAFTLEKIEEMNGLGIVITHKNEMYQFTQIFDNKTLTEYPVETSSIVIANNRFILEHIDSIKVNLTYQKTKQVDYQLIKDLSDIFLSLYISEYEGVASVTVYEHLNVIHADYDKITNSIICTNKEDLEFPIAINGEIKGIVTISPDYSFTSTTMYLDATEPIAQMILNQIPFIVATPPSPTISGFVISDGEQLEIIAPVIVRKAYPQLVEEAKKMAAYQELFTFYYNFSDNY